MFGNGSWAGMMQAGGMLVQPEIPSPFTYNCVCVDSDFAYKACLPNGGIVGPPINPNAWLVDEFGGKNTVVTPRSL